MTNVEDMDCECCEEELSDIQKECYEKALKEYNQAITEACKKKKEGTIISKNGNVCVVKSTYQVRLGNSMTPVISSVSGSAPVVQTAPQKTVQTTVSTTILASIPPIPQGGLLKSTPVVSQQISSTIQQPNAAPSSKQSLQVTELASQRLGAVGASAKPTIVTSSAQQSTKPTSTITVVSTVGTKSNLPSKVSTTPVVSSATTINISTTKTTGESKVSTSSQQGKTQQKPEQKSNVLLGPSVPIAQHTVEMTPEDSRLAKNHPSLLVTVKPSKILPAGISTKKREALDGFVKSRLVLNASQFAEWLMQSGLASSKQIALCPLHPLNPASPLQLGMSREEGKFPHSGGYVWISQCCNKSFVSIFAGSIFEDSSHPPTSLLKLIYHWACQTSVSNVVQWVKVDRSYIRLFYGMMRSVCTVSIHSSTPMFGTSKNGRVEVGVISLGTTSTDGKRRDVKVEVLGIYDQETQKIRLRASEPVVGDTRSRARFARILEPLPSWVSTQAIVLTDFTVDRSTLQELGFQHVVQKTLSTVSSEDRLNNRNIMEYLRRTVPKVFQNTLSLLSTGSIQQFLDELVWREARGQSAADAFHNVVEDIKTQTAAETGTPLVNRLSAVGTDPFKDWSLPRKTTPAANAQPSQASTTNSAPPTGSSAVKRPAPASALQEGTSVKVPKTPVIYYANLPPSKQDARSADSKATDTTCQVAECRKGLKFNLEIMQHMRQHINGMDNEQCIYCLREFATAAQKKQHVIAFHESIISFKEGAGKEDSAAVKSEMCLICLERFKQHQHLEQHLQSLHVSYEVPYRCRACNFRSSVHTHLVDHFHSQHATSCLLLCPLCLDTFTTKGDNTTRGMDTGHMQYLAHLKSHESIPIAKKNRCKRCLLTFLQPDQLQHHVKMDHVSMAANLAARPLNVTVLPASTAPASSTTSPATMTTTTTMTTLTLVTSPPPVPVNVATPQPAPAPVTAASPVVSISTASPASCTNQKPASKVQSKAKEAIAGVDSSMVVRRFSSLVVDKEECNSKKCIECKQEMRMGSHFPAYLCCPSCRFATCCATAMKKHHDQVHAKEARQKSGTQFGSVFALSCAVRCQCGFQSESGLDVGRHLAQCDSGRIQVEDS